MVRRKLLLYDWGILIVFILANTNISPSGTNLDQMDEKVRGIYLSLADMYALLCGFNCSDRTKIEKVWRLVFASAVLLFLLHLRGTFVIF